MASSHLEFLTSVASALQQLGYAKTLRALRKETELGIENIDERSTAPLLSLHEQWLASQTRDTEAAASDSNTSSESESEDSDSESEGDAAEGALVDVEAEETSDDESDEKSKSGSDSSSNSSSTSHANVGAKRKRVVTPPSSDDDDDSSSSISSSSSESDVRPAKRTKVVSSLSSSPSIASGSSASNSEGDSDSDSDSTSASDSDSTSSSDSSDSESDASPPPAKKTKKVKGSKPDQTTGDSETGSNAALLKENGSQSSETLDAESTAEKEQDNEEPANIHPDRLRLMPTTKKEAAAQQKKLNIPFSRIPTDQKVDPRFASNEYVSYDYADRAYQDLSVTKGKGFTKEKNKKKRGAYRGGAIDFTPKGIKFDD